MIAMQSMAQPPTPAPPVSLNAGKPIPGLSYQIKVRFLPVGSGDGTIVANVDKKWCDLALAEINAIFKPAGLRFVLGGLDAVRKDDLYNLDVPPQYPSYATGTEMYRQKLAEKFPKELVVFVRRYLGDEKGQEKFYKAFHYSSVSADYVVAEPESAPRSLAHEFGHFFGLPHTFREDVMGEIVARPYSARVGHVARLLAGAIERGDVTEGNALQFLDGDGIDDTPPDAGPPIFQPNDKAGEEIAPGSPAEIIIPVTVRRPPFNMARKVNYTLRPDKRNLMSYFTQKEMPHLSRQQAQLVYKIVNTGSRKRLVTGQSSLIVP